MLGYLNLEEKKETEILYNRKKNGENKESAFREIVGLEMAEFSSKNSGLALLRSQLVHNGTLWGLSQWSAIVKEPC